MADRRNITGAGIPCDELRNIRCQITDFLGFKRVVDAVSEIICENVAGAQTTTCVLFVEGTGGLPVTDNPEQIKAGSKLTIQEVRLCKTEVYLAAFGSNGDGCLQILTATKQVTLTNTNIDQRTIKGRETGTQ